MRWDLIRLAGGFLAAGALVVVADRLVSRSRPKLVSSSGFGAGGDSPFVGAGSTPKSYYELMLMRQRRKQDRQLASLSKAQGRKVENLGTSQSRKVERGSLLDERAEREAALAREAERLNTSAERREMRVDRLQERTALRDQDAQAYLAEAGLLYIGDVNEVQSARKAEASAAKDRRSAAGAKRSASHALAAAKASRKAGQASKSDVKAARQDLKGARETLHKTRYAETAAEQTLRKEQAERRAQRRHDRAVKIESGVQPLSDFQAAEKDPDLYGTPDGLYDEQTPEAEV